MTVGEDLGQFDRQVHRLHDSLDDGFLPQNAPVGAERVPASLRVVDDATTRMPFILGVTGQVTESLVLSPVIDVARGMVQAFTVRLCGADRGTIDDQPIFD